MVAHYFMWMVLCEAWSNQFILHREIPNGLAFKPEEVPLLCEKLQGVFIELHRIDYRKIVQSHQMKRTHFSAGCNNGVQ